VIALKDRLMKIYGHKYKDYVDSLKYNDLLSILGKFGLVEVENYSPVNIYYGFTDKDKHKSNDPLFDYMKGIYDFKERQRASREKNERFLVFQRNLKNNKCISCGGETGSDYLEKGNDIVSSPMCDSCELGKYEELFLKERGLMDDFATMMEKPTDPSELENVSRDTLHGDYYGED